MGKQQGFGRVDMGKDLTNASWDLQCDWYSAAGHSKTQKILLIPYYCLAEVVAEGHTLPTSGPSVDMSSWICSSASATYTPEESDLFKHSIIAARFSFKLNKILFELHLLEETSYVSRLNSITFRITKRRVNIFVEENKTEKTSSICRVLYRPCALTQRYRQTEIEAKLKHLDSY